MILAGGIFILLAPGAGDPHLFSPGGFLTAMMFAIGIILIALARISWQLYRPAPSNPKLVPVDRPGRWRCPRCRALLESVIQPGADRVDGLEIVQETG